MRIQFCLGIVLLLTYIKLSTANNQTTQPPTNLVKGADKRIMVIDMIGRKIKSLWDIYVNKQNEETFVGRCLGMAKRIRQMLPIIVFMLGVIMTLLGFLTLFSLKSLALLILLLIINTSGAVAKIAATLSHKEKDEHKKPGNIHLHIHSNKHGHYLDSSSYDWEDKSDKASTETDLDTLESYNLYNKLIRNPYLRNYRSFDR